MVQSWNFFKARTASKDEDWHNLLDQVVKVHFSNLEPVFGYTYELSHQLK